LYHIVPRESAAPTPDPRIRRWLERDLAAHPPRASSLIVTLWGDALGPHGGDVWLSTLFRLLAPFGVGERLARTSVFRLARDGWLAAQTVGRRSRYRLTTEGARRFAQAYQRVYTPPSQPWNRHWEFVLAPTDASSSAKRRALRNELAWEGFGTFAPGVYARPSRAASAVGRIVEALDLRDAVTVFTARDDHKAFGRSLADRVGDAWSLGSLATDYRRFVARFAPVTDALHALDRAARDPQQAFVVRTLVVHAYRRVRLRDPQLPAALLDAGWPGADAYALCHDFYRLARPLAEAHLEAVTREDGDRLAPPSAEFRARFAAD
jgi:phenylacetic acid degradation operon negative regulatory protein